MNIKELIVNSHYRIKYEKISDLYKVIGKNVLKSLMLDNIIRLKDNYAYINPNKVKTEIEAFPYVYDVFKGKIPKSEILYLFSGEHKYNTKKKKKRK